jgi:heat shock protein beta
VTLHLKEDAQELGDPVRLSRLIKQYSQFISFPIKLYSSKKEPFKVSKRAERSKLSREDLALRVDSLGRPRAAVTAYKE